MRNIGLDSIWVLIITITLVLFGHIAQKTFF